MNQGQRTFKGWARKLAFAVFAAAASALTGAVVGVIVRLVLWTVSAVSDLIWADLADAVDMAVFPLVACAAGGLVIGLYTKYADGVPASLDEVVSSIKERGRYEVQSVPRSIGGFVLPLVFGGAVGPEAGLAGLVATGCSWVSRTSNLIGKTAGEAVSIGVSAAASAVFGAPFAGAALLADSEKADDENDAADDSRRKESVVVQRVGKAALCLVAAFGAFGGMWLVGSFVGRLGGFPRFESFSVELSDLAALAPALFLAYLLAILWLAIGKLLASASDLLGERKVVKPVIAGMAIGALALVVPQALFSGEHQLEMLMTQWASFDPAWLIVIALAKLFATALCLNFGWHGGHFFPHIFVGVSAGYALASFMGVDAGLCVAVVCAAFLSAVMRRPVLVVCLLFLCFPVHGVLWLVLAAFVGSVLPLPKKLLAG